MTEDSPFTAAIRAGLGDDWIWRIFARMGQITAEEDQYSDRYRETVGLPRRCCSRGHLLEQDNVKMVGRYRMCLTCYEARTPIIGLLEARRERLGCADG